MYDDVVTFEYTTMSDDVEYTTVSRNK